MNLCYVSDYCLAMMRSGAWGMMVDIVNSTRTSKSMPPPVSDILGMRMARRKVLETQGTEGKGFPPQNGYPIMYAGQEDSHLLRFFF